MANNFKKKEVSEECEAAITVLRALVCSKKGPSTVRSILSDYRELEGGPLMYKKFGYPSADEFLKSTGEFVVENRMGETVIYVKPSKESAHILKMVAAQKKTKTKKSGFAIMRQPQKKTGGNNWNPSVYNKMYSQMPHQANRFTQRKNTAIQYPQQQRSGNPLIPFFQANARWVVNNQNFNSVRNNNSNHNPIQQLMSVKLLPPAVLPIQNQLNHNNQRVIRPEANNNNATIKNLNKSVQSTVKPGVLASNDLRHKLQDKASSQQLPMPQQRQLSSLELRNRVNQHSVEYRDDLNNTLSQRRMNTDAIQRMVYNAVSSNQSQMAPIAAVVSPGTAATMQNARSVNSRLQLPIQPAPNVVSQFQEPVKVAPTVVYSSNGITPTKHNSVPQSVILPTVPTPPPTVVQLPTLPGRKTLQDRLKINQKVDSSDLEKASKVTTPQSPPPKAPDFEPKPILSNPQVPPVMNQNRTKELSLVTQQTPVEMLVQYAQSNGFSRPIYKYFKLKNKRIQCRITVNGLTYSTYPEDYANEFEGQFAAASIAIENIKREEDRKNYSVCLDSDYEIALKIHDLLLNCAHGMFSKNIPDAFRNAHQASLPDHWEFIILSHSRLFSKEVTHGNTIVFANVQEDNDSNGPAASITSEAKCMLANLLVLPWNDQYWNLYITNPVSTVEIWARLVGIEYSDQMDTLITNIEMAMLDDNKPKPKSVAVGEYYLVSTNECWHRVRAEEIDFESNSCMLFFIDIGEWERKPLDEIYACDPKYLELPGQTVCFSLDGLEDFGENPKAKVHLDNLINGKVCIGEILTPKDEYEGRGDNEVRIRMILYDTSSEEDINLNSIILKHICDDTPEPALSRKGVTMVCISYVDDLGDVHCQLKDTAMVYIQKLINNLVQSNALDGKHRGLYKTSSGQQLYLVQDDRDNKWYRATLVASESGASCKMLFVDMGYTKSVNISDIYRLEMLSVALSRYPAQAIRIKMFNIPEVNEYLLSRLRALLKPGLTAMVKVVACTSVIPLVKIYMHLEQNNILVCVNDSIRSEMELEISSEVISDPRINNTESSNSSSISTSNLNSSFSSDYSINTQEATDLSKHFSALNIEQPKPSSPISVQIVPKLAKFTLPAVGEFFDVYVTIVSNPNYFFVRPHSQTAELNQMMIKLQEYCMSKKAQLVPKDGVQQGDFYAGLKHEDGQWYRLLVVNIFSGPTMLHVYFCDFGQIGILDSSSLRILPQHLRTLPQQAIKAKLFGVKPVHGDWSAEDAVRFQQLTVEKQFASYIRSIQTDEFDRKDEIVELTLIDVSTDEDILIHEILVQEKRAVLVGK